MQCAAGLDLVQLLSSLTPLQSSEISTDLVALEYVFQLPRISTCQVPLADLVKGLDVPFGRPEISHFALIRGVHDCRQPAHTEGHYRSS